MAIIGKKKYGVYLSEKEAEIVKKWLDKRKDKGGLSGLLNNHLIRCARLIEKNEAALSEIEPGRMTVRKFIKLAKLKYVEG